jgi:hypothetical protein
VERLLCLDGLLVAFAAVVAVSLLPLFAALDADADADADTTLVIARHYRSMPSHLKKSSWKH